MNGQPNHMKKFIPLLLTALFLISCNSKENQAPTRITKQLAKTDAKFDVLPAFSISDSIDAIVFELLDYEIDKKDFYEEIYDQVAKEDTLYDFSGDNHPYLKPINATYIDTSGQFNILRSQKLEKRLKEKLKPSYYVYGTLGYTKVSIGDVYFTVDECLSNIIAIKLNGYNRKKYGHPLFCSEKPLGLVYGKNYAKELKAIHQFDRELAQKVDYSNALNSTKIFANKGSYYFAYEDDFASSREYESSKIKFPSRTIYSINDKGKADCIWGKCLDLFGIPCD